MHWEQKIPGIVKAFLEARIAGVRRNLEDAGIDPSHPDWVWATHPETVSYAANAIWKWWARVNAGHKMEPLPEYVRRAVTDSQGHLKKLVKRTTRLEQCERWTNICFAREAILVIECLPHEAWENLHEADQGLKAGQHLHWKVIKNMMVRLGEKYRIPYPELHE